MSGGYADRLKHYPNKGVCGLPEQLDTERQLQAKLEILVKRVRDAKHLVVFTGAGISTAAGIPDFRGPSGIWTVQQAKDAHAIVQTQQSAHDAWSMRHGHAVRYRAKIEICYLNYPRG